MEINSKDLVLGVLNAICLKDDLDMEVDGMVRTVQMLLDPQSKEETFLAVQEAYKYLGKADEEYAKMEDMVKRIAEENGIELKPDAFEYPESED